MLHSITQEASSDLKTGNLGSEELASLATGFHNVLQAFGLDLTQSEAGVQEIPETIKALAEQRAAARGGKDWAEAERLRDELCQAGWEMRDKADGYELTKL